MKEDFCFKDKSQIANEILVYLTDHPDAQDTLEGIMQWWLLERGVNCQIDKVKEALGDLVAEGWILEYRSAGSKIRYGINRSKYDGIQTFLKQRKG